MLDDVTKSKEQLVEKYEEELKRMKMSADEVQRKLLEDHRLVVDAANQRHGQEMSTERLQAETNFTRMKQVGDDCIVFIPFYSASHGISLLEALLTTAIVTLSEFTRQSASDNCK